MKHGNAIKRHLIDTQLLTVHFWSFSTCRETASILIRKTHSTHWTTFHKKNATTAQHTLACKTKRDYRWCWPHRLLHSMKTGELNMFDKLKVFGHSNLLRWFVHDICHTDALIHRLINYMKNLKKNI